MPLLIVVFVVASSWPVPADYGDEPLTVIVTHPDERYYVGDTIVVRAYVFRNGGRFDPDRVELSTGSDYTDHPIERLTAGLWEGSVRIDGDQLEWGSFFPIEVKVSVEGPVTEWTWERREVFVHDAPHYHLNVHMEDLRDAVARPGDVVDFLVTTTRGTQFVDPDEGSLTAWANSSSWDWRFSEEIELDRMSVGTFRGTFTVPSDIVTDRGINIMVGASFENSPDRRDYTGGVGIMVRFFDVWFKNGGWHDGRTSMEVRVLDLEGRPVEGATVGLNVSYMNETDLVDSYPVNLTTDGTGTLTFSIGHPEFDPKVMGLWIAGMVSDGTYTQHAYTWLENPDYEEPPPDPASVAGFRALNLFDARLPTGENAELRFLLTHNGTPLTRTEVHTYVYDPNDVIFFGSLETDDEGVLTVNVDVPSTRLWGGMSGMLRALFKAVTPEGHETTFAGLEQSYWNNSWDEMGWQSYNTSMDLVDQGDGDFMFEIRSADLDGAEESVRVEWRTGPAWHQQEWQYPFWTQGYDVPPLISEATWDGECYRGTIDLPDFLPVGTLVGVRVYITLHDVPHSATRYAFAVDAAAYAATTAPTVSIVRPVEGAVLDDQVVVLVKADDDVGVKRIGVRLDGGDWTFADGVDSCEISFSAEELEEGVHVLEARAWDGVRFSETDRVEFTVEREEVVAFDTTPFWSLLVALVVIIVIVVALLTRRDGTDGPQP